MACMKYITTETLCQQCGVIAPHRTESGTWGPHRRRLRCEACGAHIRWLPVTSPAARQAAKQRGIATWMQTQAPTASQLRYLQVLGYGGTPANRLEASQAIDALLGGREVARG